MLFHHAGNRDSYQSEKFMRGCRFLEAELQDMDRILSGQYVLFCLVSYCSANFLHMMLNLYIDLSNLIYEKRPIDLKVQ